MQNATDLITEHANAAVAAETKAVDDWLRSYGFTAGNIQAMPELNLVWSMGQWTDDGRFITSYTLRRGMKVLGSMRFVHKLEIRD